MMAFNHISSIAPLSLAMRDAHDEHEPPPELEPDKHGWPKRDKARSLIDLRPDHEDQLLRTR